MRQAVRCAVRLAALTCVVAMAFGASAQQPAAGARVGPNPAFEWTNSPQFDAYYLAVRAAEDPAPWYYSVAANDPAACADSTICRLVAGHPAYPSLAPGRYDWVTFGRDAQTHIWQSWSPADWSAFDIEIPAPTLEAVWDGDSVRLRWSRVTYATKYAFTLRHEASAPLRSDFTCAAEPCTGTVNVAHIPYGTLRVELRSCDAARLCSKTPTVVELTRNCPDTPATPMILSPQSNTSAPGFLALQFSNVAYAERYHISVHSNGVSPSEVIDEEVGLSQLQCGAGVCLRVFPMIAGSYTVQLSAACANAWSAPVQRDFAISAAQTTPSLLTPTEGQATSVYPLIAWRRIAQIDRYEVTATDVSTQAKQQAVVTCQVEDICALDTWQARWNPMNGPHDISVRIAMLAMPDSTVRFRPSPEYVPPEVERLSPDEGERVPWPLKLLLSFSVDPQVPWVHSEIDGPGAFTASADFNRTGPDCRLESGAPLAMRCTKSLELTSSGVHDVFVQTRAPTGVAGQERITQVRHSFIRYVEAIQGVKSIYSIYAQNTQFLPPSPLNGGASSAYGMDDRERARRLADYIRTNNFDVVALSEVFMFPPKEILNQKLVPLYHGVSNIDTQGRVSIGTIGGIVGGYFAGWWVGAQAAGAAVGWGINFEDWFKSANSGLAIYSRFPIVEYDNTADDNSQCTDDLFNELDEDHPDSEGSFLINRRVRFRQYCHGTGADKLSAKGFAAVQLQNTRTGLPLWIMWSHTQAYTGGTSFAGLPDGNYKDSYEARATQVEDNAGPAMAHILSLTPEFDAFVLGDWNIPQPPSLSGVPRKHDGSNAQDDGWPGFDRMYNAPPTPDARNPLLSSLVGEHAPGSSDRLFDQYWAYFDPRNGRRTFSRFTDLWLFNPAGDPGYTFEPGRNPVATCVEVGEPCHDRGARYDTVLASFHAWNALGGGPTYDSRARAPAWIQSRSCVLHTRRALDFSLSDHWGTIIEVGPSAPYCGPNTAKADPHKWRVPADAEAQPVGFDDAAGRHRGRFAYGGANEWFYLSQGGSIDVVAVRFAEAFQGLVIEAYDARDLSTPLTVGAEQDPKQILYETCPEAAAYVGRKGHIPELCATASRRLTYTHDGPFFIRIRPAKNGTACLTCVGDYEVLFRERFCQEHFEAIPVKPRLPGATPTTAGWFGAGSVGPVVEALSPSECWFSFDLPMPSTEAEPQTLVFEGLHALNTQYCREFGGDAARCSDKYELQIYNSSPPTDDSTAPARPTELLIDAPLTLSATTDAHTIPTSVRWFAPLEVMTTGVMPKSQKRTFYALLKRSDASTAQRAGLPWVTNLRTVTYNAVSTSDIEDDVEIEIEICLPFLGCIIRGITDPFETEDEIAVSLWIDGHHRDGGSKNLNIDNAGSDAFPLPHSAPGMTKECEGYAYQWCGNEKHAAKFGLAEFGTTVNYTDYSQITVREKDSPTGDDTVISDIYNCDWPGTPAPYASSWQASEFRRAWDERLKGAPANLKSPMRFSDDCPDSDPQFNYYLKATVPELP